MAIGNARESGQRGPCATRPTADSVAATITGIVSIQQACEAFRVAGWPTVVAGNRIAIDNRVFARYVDPSATPAAAGGNASTNWVVYGIGERPTVRIVVADLER